MRHLTGADGEAKELPSRWDDIVEWVPKALAQRARCELDWCLNRRQRWWYTAKAMVCVLLGRDEYRGYGPSDAWPAQIEVAMTNFVRWQHHEFGDAADWDYLAVGHGVRSGWWFKVASAGYP